MKSSIGRKLQDVAQKARGRYALRYEIELIPYFVGDIPDKVQRVLFCWERGTKLFVTDAEKVNPNTKAVFFKQYLRQVATIYHEGDNVLPKEFSFKIQSVTKGSKGDDERKTIGKVKVDLAQFCDGQEDPQPQDIFLQCKPHGKLKVSVKASWLKDHAVDPDAMTEVTQATSFSEATGGGGSRAKGRGKGGSRRDEQGEGDYHEQDLSGFDHGEGGAGPHDREGGGGRDDGGGGGRGQGGGGKGRKGRRRKQLEDEIPEGFEAPIDPEEQQQLEGEGEGEDGAPRTMPRLVLQGPVGAGTQIHKSSWRDYVCCCCGPSQPLDPHESAGLLNDKQANALDMQNNHLPVEQRKKRKKKKKAQLESVPQEDGDAQELPPWQGRK